VIRWKNWPRSSPHAIAGANVRPSVTEYTDKYPDLAEQIRELFPALVAMEQLGSVAGPPTGPFNPIAGDRDILPELLGDNRILRKVGRGGMGVVYEAVQESLGRHVARSCTFIA
jgi:hypothetical protein